MDSEKLNSALQSVETNYHELVEIANDTLNSILGPLDSLVSEVSDNLNSLSVDMIRDYIMRIQTQAYKLSEIKEKSAMKAELASALQKEKYAKSFSLSGGSSATARSNDATIEAMPEVAASTLYDLMANMLKTKLDGAYRMVDSLKSVLMSRMQEIKFQRQDALADGSTTMGNDPGAYAGGFPRRGGTPLNE